MHKFCLFNYLSWITDTVEIRDESRIPKRYLGQEAKG